MEYPGLICECGCKDKDHFEQCGALSCKNCSIINMSSSNVDTVQSFSVLLVSKIAYYKGIKLQCMITVEA